MATAFPHFNCRWHRLRFLGAMVTVSGKLEAISRLLSDLSGQLHKTQDSATRRELLKQMRLLLDKVDRIIAEDFRET